MCGAERSRNICVFAKSRHLRASCCHRQKKTNLMKWTLNVAFRSFFDSSFNFIHPFLIICRHLHTLPNIFKMEYYRARCGYSEPFCYCKRICAEMEKLMRGRDSPHFFVFWANYSACLKPTVYHSDLHSRRWLVEWNLNVSPRSKQFRTK